MAETDSRPSTRTIHVIVAVARNGVIGNNNALPWRLAKDLKRFRALTMGHPILMGRKTYDSINRVLPGRRMIVLSRQPDLKIEGCEVVATLNDAMESIGVDEELFVIGGGEIYRQSLGLATHLHLTHVFTTSVGDAQFHWVPSEWTCMEQHFEPADEANQWPTLYQHWLRATSLVST